MDGFFYKNHWFHLLNPTSLFFFIFPYELKLYQPIPFKPVYLIYILSHDSYIFKLGKPYKWLSFMTRPYLPPSPLKAHEAIFWPHLINKSKFEFHFFIKKEEYSNKLDTKLFMLKS